MPNQNSLFSPLARPRPASKEVSSWSSKSNGDKDDLSLIPCRNLSIVIRVHLLQQSIDEQQHPRMCLFPLIPDIPPTTDNLRSPVSATLQAASMTPTNELVLVNPSVFGKYIPSEVTIETARLVANVANIQSEDWARRYRFDEVVWPTLEASDDRTCPSLVKLAQSMASNAVSHGQSSTCLAIGASDSGKTLDLFGDAIEQPRGNVVPARFGLLGLIFASILDLSEHAVCTLSLLEIVDEEVLRDLLATDHVESQLQLKMQHPDNKGAIVRNLTEEPMDSLTNLDHLMRKAFHSQAALRARKGEGPRGHVMATIRLWENGIQHDLSNLARCTTIDLVDLASGSDSRTTVNARSTRRMASFRKSFSGLRGVLRSLLLRTADESLTNPISFRECTLTKLLQRPLVKQCSRTVVLAAVCSRSESYEKTLYTLNYVNRLLIRPGRTARSPLATFRRVSLLSRKSPLECMWPSLGADGIFDRYGGEDSFLQNILSDPRQRLAKLMKPRRSTHAPMTRTGLQLKTDNEDSYEPYDYMQIDPIAINEMHSSWPLSPALEKHSNQESSTVNEDILENRETDKQNYYSSRIRPSPTRKPTLYRFQNAPHADERNRQMQEIGMSNDSSLSDEDEVFQIEQQLEDANNSRFEMESFLAPLAESKLEVTQVDHSSFIVKTVTSESDEFTPSCQPTRDSTENESFKLSRVALNAFTQATEKQSHDAYDITCRRQCNPLHGVIMRIPTASATRDDDMVSRSTSENDNEALGMDHDSMLDLDNYGHHENQTSNASVASKPEVVAADLGELQSHSVCLSMSRTMNSPLPDTKTSLETNLAPSLHSKCANGLSMSSPSSSLPPCHGVISEELESTVGTNEILGLHGITSLLSANEFEAKPKSLEEIRQVAPIGHLSSIIHSKASLSSPPLSRSKRKSHREEVFESQKVSHRKETMKSIQTCITDQADSQLGANDYLDKLQLLEGAVDLICKVHSEVWESSALSLRKLRMYRHMQQATLQEADNVRKEAEVQAELVLREPQRQSRQSMDQVSELKDALRNARDDRAALENIAGEAIVDYDRLEMKVSATETEIGKLRDKSRAQIVDYNLVLEAKESISVKLESIVKAFNKLQADHKGCKNTIEELKKDAKHYSDKRSKFDHESDICRRRMNDMSRLEIDHANLKQDFDAATHEVVHLREENAEIVTAFDRHKGKSSTEAKEWEAQRTAMDHELKASEAELAFIQHRHKEESTALRRVATQLQGERSTRMTQMYDTNMQLEELEDERSSNHSGLQQSAKASTFLGLTKYRRDEELQGIKDLHTALMHESEIDKVRIKQMHQTILTFQTNAKDKIKVLSNENEALKSALEATRNEVHVFKANQTALLQRDRCECCILNNEIETLREQVNDELFAKPAAFLQSRLEDHQEETYSTRREARRFRAILTELHKEVEGYGETENGLREIKDMTIEDTQGRANLPKMQEQVIPIIKHLQNTTSRSGTLPESKVKCAQRQRVLDDETRKLGTSLASAAPSTATSAQLERLRYEQIQRRQADDVAAAMAARAKWSLEKRNEEIMYLKIRLSALADEKELEITKLRSKLHTMRKQTQWTQGQTSRPQNSEDCDFWNSGGSEY